MRIDWPPLDNIKIPNHLFEGFLHSADKRYRSDLYAAYLAAHARIMCTDKNDGVMMLYKPTTECGQLATRYLVKQAEALHNDISTLTRKVDEEGGAKLGNQSKQQALVHYDPSAFDSVVDIVAVVKELEQKVMDARAKLAWACALPYTDFLSLNL